jgi:hypothetical protein
LVFAITDPDAGSAPNLVFTLAADHGTLTLASTTGLTLITGANGTSLMTYEGTLTDLNLALNEVTYRGAQDYFGSDTITFISSDNGNTGAGGTLTDTDSVSVTVNPINDAPVLDPIGNQIGDELLPVAFTANANDLEGHSLTFSLDAGAPTSASIDASSGSFTWTPTSADAPGIYPITVRVTDNGVPTGDDFETILVTVNAAPTVSDFTKIGPVNTPIDLAFPDFAAQFSDEDGDVLEAVKIITLPGEGTLQLNGVAVSVGQEIIAADLGLLRFIPAFDWRGTTSFTWTGSDGRVYASADATMTLTVGSMGYSIFLPIVKR